jgi:mono/diheme cytochrome c family protein
MENRKQPFDFFPSIWTRTAAGIFSFTGIMILVFWIAINEPARMDEFTERSDGRSVEAGALLFESNCSTCHGTEGLGQAGRAPALNNPFLLNYDFGLGALETQLASLDKDIAATEDVAEKAILQLERDYAQAQYDLIVDDLIYDYSAPLAEAEEKLAALDEEIVSAGYDAERISLDAAALKQEIATLDAQLVGTAEEPGPKTLMENADANGNEYDPTWVEQREELEAQIDALEAELAPLAAFDTPRTQLTTAINDLRPLVDAHMPIHDARVQLVDLYAQKMADRSLQIDEDVTALQTTITDGMATRTTAYDTLVTGGKITALPDYVTRPMTSTDPAVRVSEITRMANLKWNGTLHDLIFATVSGGRPTSASYWPQPMAAWSQSAGGPLRGDQIENLADYVMNFQRDFTVADVRKIKQFAKIPSDVEVPPIEAVGTDVAAIVAGLETTEGDSNAGQALFNGALGCAGCHTGVAAPDMAGVAGRAEQHATEDPTNYPTPRHYLVTSIVNPPFYVVEGFQPIMPTNFGERLTIEDMANLIAYLESLDQ